MNNTIFPLSQHDTLIVKIRNDKAFALNQVNRFYTLSDKLELTLI